MTDEHADAADQPPADTAGAGDTTKPDTGAAGTDDSTIDPIDAALMAPDGDDDEQPGDPPATDGERQETDQPDPNTTVQPGEEDPPTQAGTETPPAATGSEGDEADADEAEVEALLEKLPEEDWGKLTHKSKSHFLDLQRTTRKLRENVEAYKPERERLREAEQDLAALDELVEEAELEHKEAIQAIAFRGLVRKNDPRTVKVLEEQLQAVRQANGMPAPAAAQAAPAVTADELSSAITKAEDDIDFDALRGLVEKLKGSGSQPPAQPGGEATPPPAAAPPAPTPTPQPSAQPAGDGAGDGAPPQADEARRVVAQNLVAYLTGEGIAQDQLNGYLTELARDAVQAHGGQQPEVGQLFSAIQKAHLQRKAKQSTPRPPGGVGGPQRGGRGGGSRTPSKDPLEHALG